MKRYVVLSSFFLLLSAGITGEVAYASDTAFNLQQKSALSKGIVQSYLDMKNALADDNGPEAAKAGAAIMTEFKNYDQGSLNQMKKDQFGDIASDASENAEHISQSGSDISHQREHFELLSKDIYDLVTNFGAGQVLYRIFCRTYNNGKGAYWLSETRDMKNPYFGKAVTNCGTVAEELKP